MNFKVFSLLVVGLIVCSSALARPRKNVALRGLHSKFEGGNSQHSKRQADDDHVSGLPPMDECEISLMQCQTGYWQLENKGIEVILKELHQNGLKEACGVVTEAIQCVRNLLNSPVCVDLSQKEYYTGVLQSVSEAHDYICYDKASEIEENGDCLFDTSILDNIYTCLGRKIEDANDNNVNSEECDPRRKFIRQCFEEVIETADQCNAEAKSIYLYILMSEGAPPESDDICPETATDTFRKVFKKLHL